MTNTMKIVIINSSPRKNGVTNLLLSHMKEGMETEGASVDMFDLYKQKIKFCDGCFRCWYEHPSICKIQDDFNGIYNKVINADLVVFASPIYGMIVNAMLKSFMERLSMVSHLPDFKIDEMSSKMVKPMQDHLPPVALVLSGNMSGREIFDSSYLFFNEYFRITNTKIVGRVFRHQSELLIKPILDKQRESVMEAMFTSGSDLVKYGRIKESTKEQAEQDLLCMKDFIDGHNLFWKICTKKKINPLKLDFQQYPLLKL